MNYTPDTEAWVKLPLELLKRSGISQRAAVLLAVIIDRCKHDGNLSAPISADELHERSGMSRRTIFRALDELRKLELVRIDRTGRQSVYSITPGCVELCPKAVKDEKPGAAPARSGSRARSGGAVPAPNKYEQLARLIERQILDEPLPGQLEFSTEEVST